MMSPGDILNGKKREEERKSKSHSFKPSCHLEIILAGIEVVQKSDPAWFAHMFANLKFLKKYGHLLVVGWRMIFFFHSHSHPLLIGFSLFCGGGGFEMLGSGNRSFHALPQCRPNSHRKKRRDVVTPLTRLATPQAW